MCPPGTQQHASSRDAVERRAPRQLSKVAWSPAGDMDHAAWVAAGRQLGRVGRGSQWWIGDWLRYGGGKWGEKYVEASKITGYAIGSLRNMASLASQFDLSRRRDNLTWEHHAAVAGLEPQEQEMWLDQAVALKLSVADLRIEIRSARRSQDQLASESEGSKDTGPSGFICPNCGQVIPASPQLTDEASSGDEIPAITHAS